MGLRLTQGDEKLPPFGNRSPQKRRPPRLSSERSRGTRSFRHPSNPS